MNPELRDRLYRDHMPWRIDPITYEQYQDALTICRHTWLDKVMVYTERADVDAMLTMLRYESHQRQTADLRNRIARQRLARDNYRLRHSAAAGAVSIDPIRDLYRLVDGQVATAEWVYRNRSESESAA